MNDATLGSTRSPDGEPRESGVVNSPMLGVVIVSWNVRELLRGCLRSLREQSGVAMRVIVVDSASADDSAAMVRAEFPEVELIASTENIGYVKGNNAALRRLLASESGVGGESVTAGDRHSMESAKRAAPPRRGRRTARFAEFTDDRPNTSASEAMPEFVWLLNPDTIVQPGAAATLLRFMREHPRCGLCGPQLRNPDGTLQHGAFALPGLMQLAIDVAPRLQARLRDTRWDGRYSAAQYAGGPFRVGTPLGAAMLARTEAVRAVGLLDEGFEMYSEEIDWAHRMADEGWEVWCEPRAMVTHFGGASSGQASARAERLKWRSRARYFDKHYGPLRRAIARAMMPREWKESGR